MPMARPELQPGDVVRLRSGGPLMTVGSVGGGWNGCRCFWFVEVELREATISPEALERGEVAPAAEGSAKQPGKS